MKSVLLGGVALLTLAIAGPVAAADMPVKAVSRTASPAMVAAYHWTGFYIGAHGGYGAADFGGVFDSSELPAVPGFAAYGSDLDVKGAFGGAHIGYLFQNGSWVVGGEVATSFMNWSDKTFDAIPDFPGTDNVEGKIKNLHTVVAKLGYAFDSVLVYGSLGAAWANGSWIVCNCDSTDPKGSVKFNKVGLAVGGGATVAIAGPWTAGVEGLYLKFNDRKDASLLTSDSDPGDFGELKSIWVVKGTLNYRLN